MHSPIQNLLRPNSDPTPICCSGEINTLEHLSPTFLIIWCSPHASIEFSRHGGTMESCVWVDESQIGKRPTDGCRNSENSVRIFTLYNKGVFLFFFFSLPPELCRPYKCFSITCQCGVQHWLDFNIYSGKFAHILCSVFSLLWRYVNKKDGKDWNKRLTGV